MTAIGIPAQPLLNALEGVCYLCALDGEILGVGEPNWTEFAHDNGAAGLTPGFRVCGGNLFNYVSGGEVAASYRTWIEALERRRARNVSFTYRCDAPSVRREMRMSLSGIEKGDRIAAVLFQSLVVEERERPAISLFDAEHMRRISARETLLPILAMCSYCQDVRHDGAWVAPERYYAHGGTDRVRLSHGICENCYESLVEPFAVSAP
jgi:hypothetical protein